MKKILLFLMFALFCIPWAANAQQLVEIGEQTTTSSYLPTYSYYNYSLTQQIYTADEIDMAGTITSIAFKSTGSEKTRTLDIYLVATDKESFTGNTDWIAVTASDLVFSGSVTFSAGGWITIDLANTFEYDGTSNLAVIVDDNTGSYSSGMSCGAFSATSQAIRVYSDGTNYDPSAPSSYSGAVQTVKNVLQLSIVPAGGTICERPVGVTVGNITPTSCDLNIEPSGSGVSQNLRYKASSDADWTTVEGLGAMEASYSLTNLLPNTTYSVGVQTVCEENESGWTVTSFSTPAGIPLIEPFATTAIPQGWTRYSGLLNDVLNGTTALTSYSGGWNFNTGNGVFDNHAKVNIYGSSCKYWLVTPSLVMEDNVQLTFDLALTKYSGTLQPVVDTLQQDDRFVVLIATFGADTTLEILREWNNTGSEYVYNNIACSAVGQNVAIDLSNYAGQNIAIAFYGESTETGGDNNLHIDNVSIDYIPSCAKPTGLAKSDVTAHEATITWTSDAAAWQVQLNDEDPIDVTEATYTFEHLAPETAYTAKVRANCDGTYSEWTNTVSFTTAVACVVPTSFATSNVTNHGATLKWVSSASEWIVAYKVTADEEFTEITVYDTTYTFTDLAPETAYTVKVRANCGDEDGMSAWTTTRSFTTLEACPAPNNLTYTDLTVNSVTLSWTERGDATAWDLQYWIGEDTTTVEGITENPYMLTDLTAETVYGARVRSACGSAWSSSVSFEPTAKLVIGSGTATSGYLPTNTNYNYSYTQQIYTVEELGEAGLFESIDVYMTSTSAYTRNLDIYMVLTDKNAFENTSDWIAVTNADKVFSGEVTFAPQSWTTITLTEPFIYSGTQNVAIIVDDNTGVYSSRNFRTFTASANQSHYAYQDPSDIDPSAPSASYNYTSAYKNQIRILKNELGDCMKPTGFTASNETPNSVDLSWQENGASESWRIEYWSVNAEETDQGIIEEVTENPFTLTGLLPGTQYEAFVIPTCGVEEGDPDNSLMSNIITFTTLPACPAPTDLTYTALSDGVIVNWNGFSDNYNAQIGVTGEPVVLFSEDFEGLSDEWVNDTDYPWIATETAEADGYYQSGNSGEGSTTSALSVTVNFPIAGIVEFDAECMGEGSSSFWDHCDFYIDEERMLYAGANISGWNHYIFDVPAGNHTFTWSYTKDSSVNPTGDYFAIDNVSMSCSEIIWNDPEPAEGAEHDFVIEEAGEYHVRVQAVCGESASEWSEPMTFNFVPSTCTIVLNPENDFTWQETFENITNITSDRWTGVSPDCWTLVDQYTGTADTLPQVYRGFNVTEDGQYSLRMHFRYMLAMPVLDESIDFHGLRLSMYVRQPFYKYKLQIGVMTDLEDESTFTPVAIVNNSNKAKTYFECGFETVKDIVGPGRYIVFKNIGGSEGDLYCTNYLDDITLTYRSDEDCEISVPYTEDFEGLTSLTGATGVEPICWDVIAEDATLESVSKPQLYSGFNATPTGSYTLRMVNRCIYAMPALGEQEDLGAMTMTFMLRQPNSLYRLQVGVLDDENNFTPVRTIKCSSNEMEAVSVDFANYSGRRIAFRNTLVPGNGMSVDYLDYSYNYIDDINLDYTVIDDVDDNKSNVTDEMSDVLDNIAVYPNPTTGNLYIDAVGIQKVECYNAMGQLVRVYDNVLNNIDLNNLSEGVYTLRITVPQGVTMRKVVKR